MSNTSIIESALSDHIFVSEGTWNYGDRKGEPYRYEDAGWDQWEEISDHSNPQPVEVLDVGTVRVVDAQPGREGMGEHIYMVFEITDAKGDVKFYQKTGYYASFDGSNWDGDFSEVEPTEKTMTVYTAVK